jgi:hypothetical protein
MDTFNHLNNLKTIRNALTGVTGFPPAGGVAWLNEPFTPPAQNPPQLWVREHYMVVSERKVSYGLIEVLGISQYDSCYPSGKGIEAPTGLAIEIKEVFGPNADFTYLGHELTIDRSYMVSGSEYQLDASEHSNSTWFVVPVRFEWRAYVASSVDE